MNINKVTHEAGEAWKSYKKSDPVMMKKSFAMKDVLYRKSSPGRELWHAEVAFDYDFYLLVLAGAAVAAAIAVVMCRMPRSMSRAMSKRHRGKRA